MRPSITNTLTQAGIDPSSIQQQAAPAPQQSWLQKILPTAGSILGGIGGTLLGGPLGGIAGAGAGGAIGKGVENATEGQNPLQANDVTSGLEGAGGQLIGGALGSVVGKVASAAAKPAESLAGKLMQGAFKGGEKAMSMHPNDVATALVAQGISDPARIAGIADQLTGQTGVFSQGVQNALKTAATNGRAGIDITGIKTAAQQALEQEPLVQSATENKVMGIINKAHDVMLGGKTPSTAGFNMTSPSGLVAEGGSLAPRMADPGAVFDQVQNLERQASKYLASGNPESQAVGRVFQNIADNLKDPLFSPGGTPLSITSELKQQMLSQLDSTSLAKDAPGVYTQAQKEIAGAETVPDLRAAQRLWVNAKNGISAAQNNQLMAAGTTPAKIAAGTLTAATNPKIAAASLAVNSPAATKAGTSGLSKISELLQRIGAVAKSPVADAEFRPTTMAGGVLGTATAGIPNYVSGPAGQGANINPGQPTAMNNNAGMMTANPYNQLFNTLMAQEQAGAGLTPNSGQLMATLATIAPQLQKNMVATNAAANLPTAFGNAGGPQGTLGGLVTGLTGLIPGTPANALQGQQQAAQATLGNALGISPGAAGGYLPSLMQTPGVAGQQLTALQSILQSLGAGSPALQ